jgi:hypothetical protein
MFMHPRGQLAGIAAAFFRFVGVGSAAFIGSLLGQDAALWPVMLPIAAIGVALTGLAQTLYDMPERTMFVVEDEEKGDGDAEIS